MTLGLAESARRLKRGIDVRLAVDFDASIARVFEFNWPRARIVVAGVEDVVGGVLGRAPSLRELQLSEFVDAPDFLVGGPPCQGHSSLNNHTRRDDPRNEFYIRMVRAAQILRPRVVVIENVPSVRNDKRQVVKRASRALLSSGYQIAEDVVSFVDLGVAQRRRRHTILGVLDLDVDPADVLASIRGSRHDLRWAIGDLQHSGSLDPFDRSSRPSDENQRRIDWLFDRDQYDLSNDNRPRCHRVRTHSYKSMYGRLRWDEPAQTLTSGFGSMGQGRHVHPSHRRTLTPHEAARIQFFPDWFDFTAGGEILSRGTWSTMIGNAVPPKLTMELGRLLVPLV